MIRLLHCFSIKQKLYTFILTTSGLVLGLVCFAYFSYQNYFLEQTVQHELQILAQVLGRNCSAALTFDDSEAANTILRALRAEPMVVSGKIFRADGSLLGRYDSPEMQQSIGQEFTVFDSNQSGFVKHDRHLHVIFPVEFDRERIGTILLQARLDSMKKNLAEFAGLTVTTLALAMLIIFLLATRFGRIISKPIEQLTEAMATISRDKNYSLRVEKINDDELGSLTDGFNTMLTQIEDRDRLLEDHRERLEEEVEQRTVDVKKAMEQAVVLAREAEEANRAKSQFLANMSHEIRTPMNGVLGIAEILRDTPLNESQQQHVETIQKSGQSLLDVINDILDFSKIEAGKMELESIPFNLRTLVEETCQILAVHAHQKKLELLVSLPMDLPEVFLGDPARLRQVLNNLISNAIKFTEAGEIAVILTLLYRTAQRAKVQFTVRDTGIGIPLEVQDHLFQPFAQADGSTTRNYGGTGLGLSISKELISKMGGHIWLESEAGHGATFGFTLDMDITTELLDEDVAPAAVIPSARLLIVDDNATNRQILVNQAANWGLTCSEAANGVEGLRALQQAQNAGAPFDLVLLDVVMPEMDGQAMAEAIQRDETLQSPPIIMLTSSGPCRKKQDLKKLGISDCLVKPVRQADLQRALARALGAVETIPASAQQSAVRHELGLRVLIAEDNAVNRQVTESMLTKLNCRVHSVHNGREVLEALQRHQWDVILMDCQMPEMDGYEATRQIRAWERENDRQHLPIIALTAHTLSTDRDKCLAVGMDDHLGKPFNLEQLYRVLNPWQNSQRPLAPLPSGQASPDQNARTATGSVVDMQTLNAIRDLADDDPDRFLKQVVQVYLEETTLQLAQFREGLNDYKPDLHYATIAHNLKSSSANLGALHLANLFKELEGLSQEENPDIAKALLSDIVDEFARVKNCLQTTIGES